MRLNKLTMRIGNGLTERIHSGKNGHESAERQYFCHTILRDCLNSANGNFFASHHLRRLFTPEECNSCEIRKIVVCFDNLTVLIYHWHRLFLQVKLKWTINPKNWRLKWDDLPVDKHYHRCTSIKITKNYELKQSSDYNISSYNTILIAVIT